MTIRTMHVIDLIDYTVRLKRILSRMEQIATEKELLLNTEPLVLALLEEHDCETVRALAALGVTTETFVAALNEVRQQAKPATP